MPAEPELHPVAYEAFLAQVDALADAIEATPPRPGFVVGIGRGGLVPAVYLSHRLGLPMLSIDQSSREPGFAEELLAKVAAKSAAGTRLLFVDDINDSGATIDHVQRILAANGCERGRLGFAVLVSNVRSRVAVDFRAETIDRETDRRWFVFPWEAVADRAALIADARPVPGRPA